MENHEEIKLLGLWVSPFVRRVEWALKLKGVSCYDYIEEDIINKSFLLLQLNPVHKSVPVMVHNGRVISESLLILEYIDETWEHTPLFPSDPYQRAMVRFWANFADQTLLELAWMAMNSKGEEKQRALSGAIEAMQQIEEHIGGKGQENFLGGESVGYLDLAMGWIAQWLPVWEEVGSMNILDPLKFTAITAWMKRFLSHPVIRDNLPPRDKMVDYFRDKRERIMASRLYE